MSDAFVDVDLHDMTTDEARIEIKRALKTVSKFTYQIRLIHGFNRGTRIKKMISEEFRNNKQNQKNYSGRQSGCNDICA